VAVRQRLHRSPFSLTRAISKVNLVDRWVEASPVPFWTCMQPLDDLIASSDIQARNVPRLSIHASRERATMHIRSCQSYRSEERGMPGNNERSVKVASCSALIAHIHACSNDGACFVSILHATILTTPDNIHLQRHRDSSTGKHHQHKI